MKVKSLLAAGVLAYASGSNVYGDHCGGYPPDGTYSNVFVAIENFDDFVCATVKMLAQGIAAAGTGCTFAE